MAPSAKSAPPWPGSRERSNAPRKCHGQEHRPGKVRSAAERFSVRQCDQKREPPMPLVNVMVNSKAFTIACDDGEEDHLRQLAAIVDGKVRELLGSVGNVGDTRLLL